MKLGDATAQKDLLADNFLGVYETGFDDRVGHCNDLSDGPIVADYELSQARIMVLSEGMVLLSYFSTSRFFEDGSPGETKGMYISSIWRQFGAVWKNIFSQDTTQVSA